MHINIIIIYLQCSDRCRLSRTTCSKVSNHGRVAAHRQPLIFCICNNSISEHQKALKAFSKELFLPRAIEPIIFIVFAQHTAVFLSV